MKPCNFLNIIKLEAEAHPTEANPCLQTIRLIAGTTSALQGTGQALQSVTRIGPVALHLAGSFCISNFLHCAARGRMGARMQVSWLSHGCHPGPQMPTSSSSALHSQARTTFYYHIERLNCYWFLDKLWFRTDNTY